MTSGDCRQWLLEVMAASTVELIAVLGRACCHTDDKPGSLGSLLIIAKSSISVGWTRTCNSFMWDSTRLQALLKGSYAPQHLSSTAGCNGQLVSR